MKRRKSASKSTATRRLLLESLEHRVVMTGTWQTLTPVNPTAGPPGTQAIMQLSDGTIMVQGGNNAPTRTWFKLTPDATGDYLKGTWSSMPNMNVGRLFFTTAMLPSAKVFAVGGEYDDTGNAGGFTNTAEIYDPVTNAWNAIPPAPTPTSRFGDDPISVLPDGQVLAGYFASGLTYRYNPITNSWSTTAGSKVRNDASDEETWVKLPDDSILSYDVFSSLTSSPINTFKAQRYIPSADRWVDASNLDPANPPSILSTPNEGYELGPAFLLPDSNRVIYFGTNGNTAIYDIARNLWSAGPSEPTKVIGGTVTKLVGTDNPGAMLPNGKILITFSPQGSSAGGGYNFPSPTYVYEYDPEAQTYVEVTPSSGLGGNSFLYNMLVLPTGQIMLCDQTSRTVRVYTPDGSPQDAWRPTIEQITDDGNGTYTLTGTQLNGRGEGATYGDDWQSATNYPLVKIVDTAGNTRYARTFDWTNTGVATGSTPVSTKFTLPTGLQLNQVATFTVIANGIASNPTNLIEIHLDSGDALYTENAPPVLVSPGATIVDRFNTDLNGLKLIATIGLNSEPTDQLTIVPTGNGAGQISTTPTRIRFGGVDIGSWTKSGFQITVTFNSAASTVAAQAIIRQFAYSSTSESPGLVPRRFDVSMGGLIQSRLIRIKTLNDSPSLVDVTLPVIDEDSVQPVGRAINVLFANSFSDPDAGAQLSGIAIVSNTATGSQGTWYYSGDGGTWLPIGSVDDASKSLLLSPSSWLGFKPSPDFFGSPNPLLARSLDETFKGTFTVPGGTPIYLDPTVKVTDGPVSTNTGKVQVRVRNINDPPTATLPSVLITATQDQPVNWAFPSDLFVDIDSATLTWSILPSGVPTIASWIDFDPVNHTLKGTPHNADVGDFEFQLRATDSSDASVSIPLKISIANINDPPEQLNLRGQQVSENDPGAKVGSLTVFDPDGKDTIAYSVSDSRFTIRDGILYLQATSSVDFETEPQISITVTATDNGTPSRSTSEKFEIHVQDVNEFFPDLNPTKYVIPFSRTDNLLLGTVTAADGDIFQTVKFRIQEDDAGIFEVGETSGQVRLKPGAIVTDPSYRVFISAYDDGSPSNSRVVLFNVDVEVPNRFAPQVLPGQRFSVAENSAAGTVVGKVLAQDQDGDTNLRFSLGSGLFTINPTTGVISVAAGANLNFESLANYSIVVQVTDSGTPSRNSSLPITINLTDVNDAPTAISLASPNALAQQKGLSLSKINVVDEDPATQYLFATSDLRFEFRSGVLSLNPNSFFANSLVGTSTTVDVTVTDASDPTSSKVLPLKVDVVANPLPWQNHVNRLDVDRNGFVSALDALIVINALNGRTANLARGNLRVPRELSDLALLDVDTSGDNALSPLDAALIITALNSGANGSGGAEGEARTIGPVQPQTWFDAFTSLEQDRKRRSL